MCLVRVRIPTEVDSEGMSRRHAGGTIDSRPETAAELVPSRVRRTIRSKIIAQWVPSCSIPAPWGSRLCLSDRAFRRFFDEKHVEQAPQRSHPHARPVHRRRNRAEDDGLSRAVCDCGLCEAGRVVGRRHVRCPGAPAATSVRGVLWRRGHSYERGPGFVAWIARAPRALYGGCRGCLSRPSLHQQVFWLLIVRTTWSEMVEGSRHVQRRNGDTDKGTHPKLRVSWPDSSRPVLLQQGLFLSMCFIPNPHFKLQSGLGESSTDGLRWGSGTQ